MDKCAVEYNEQNLIKLGGALNGGCVITVGSFDGVHIGHRELIRILREKAAHVRLPAVAVTFSAGDRPKTGSKLLAQEAKKRGLLFSFGVDIIVELPYGGFRDMSAREFALGILAGALHCRHAVCGFDFRFGRGREGGTDVLGDVLSERGIQITVCPPVNYGGEPVSSTRIRQAVSLGEADAVSAMLGRPFSFASRVENGMHVASRLGVPTANQRFPAELAAPAYGVYAAECLLDGQKYRGVLNFGVKPTFGGASAPLCETHLFGFTGDIYGRECEVSFLRFLRAEEKFGSESQLRSAIDRDIAKAKAFFGLEDRSE